MAEEMVTIGCRYPNGYVLEVGLQTTVKGPKGELITAVQRKPDYKRERLKGTHWHNAPLFRQGMRPPSVLAPQPFINHIAKAFWERWKREHPNAAVLRAGDIFEVKDDKSFADGSNVKAMIVDIMKEPQPLAPIDKSKPMKIGNDIVEAATFDED